MAFFEVIKAEQPKDINQKFINLMVVSQIEGNKMQRPINKHNGSERYYDKLLDRIMIYGLAQWDFHTVNVLPFFLIPFNLL